MPVEKASTIEQLDASWPLTADQWSEGDNHLRNTKAMLKLQFPGKNGNGFNKTITATEDQLNFVEGVTSPIQDQFDAIPTTYVNKENIGGDTMAGPLTVVHELKIVRDPGPTDLDISGLTIHGANGIARGGFVEQDSDKTVWILHQGPNESDGWDTAVKFNDGKINVSSPSGKNTTPSNDNDLANKRYVDHGTLLLSQQLTSATNLITALQNSVQVLQAQVNAL